MAVKNGQLGYNESTFMPIFSAYALGFSVATLLELKFQFVKNVPYLKLKVNSIWDIIDIFLKERTIHFFSFDLVKQFWFCEMYSKNMYT